MESKKRNPAEDDPDAPPSEEERAASDRLRDALADPSRANADADFARAIAVAHTPRELDASEHLAIVERALAPKEHARRGDGRARGRGIVVRVAFGVTAAVALAAGVAFVVGAPRPAAFAAQLATTRSTQPLFGSEKFPATGGESARIDRIAMARAGDLRDNRFARWGVR